MKRFFRVLGVSGRTVRVDVGAATIDVRIETVGPGRYRVVKPEEVRMIPGVFLAMVAATIDAYKKALEQGGKS